MKIALIGYGKMGKLIEKLALERQYLVVGRITSQDSYCKEKLNEADLFIDFSHPEQVSNTILWASELKKQVVIGTTGWYERLDSVKEMVAESNIGLFYDANFSLGVHLFLNIVADAAQLMDSFHEYEIAGYEMHHSRKVDAPSGTAFKMLDLLKAKMPNRDLQNKNLETFFPSIRCGSIPGTHTLLFDSPSDSISLTHTARSREGFAQGAIQAAEWLGARKGVYTMYDMLRSFP